MNWNRFDKLQSIIMLFTSTMLYILGFINMYPELPNNISNTTILLFVLAFGIHLISRDK